MLIESFGKSRMEENGGLGGLIVAARVLGVQILGLLGFCKLQMLYPYGKIAVWRRERHGFYRW
jgi:hypothetical protein